MNFALFNRIQLGLIQDYVKKVKPTSLLLKLKYILAVKFYNTCKKEKRSKKGNIYTYTCKNKTETRDTRSITIIFSHFTATLHNFYTAHQATISFLTISHLFVKFLSMSTLQ